MKTINEVLNQIDIEEVKKDYENLFVKSCTKELSIAEEREKNRLEKVLIIFKNNNINIGEQND